MAYNILNQTRPINTIMKNPAKTILLLILLLLIVISFFALTGINLRKPEQAAYSMADQVIRINRIINQWVRDLMYSIRLWFQNIFSR
jgi:cell shape-determining protein MreC